jgi:hypothetical protein
LLGHGRHLTSTEGGLLSARLPPWSPLIAGPRSRGHHSSRLPSTGDTSRSPRRVGLPGDDRFLKTMRAGMAGARDPGRRAVPAAALVDVLPRVDTVARARRPTPLSLPTRVLRWEADGTWRHRRSRDCQAPTPASSRSSVEGLGTPGRGRLGVVHAEQPVQLVVGEGADDPSPDGGRPAARTSLSY